MKRSEKEEIIARLAEKASASSAIYFTDFSGITVEQETALRREFRKNGVEYVVAKNTLVRKALEQVTGYDSVFPKLVGPTSLVFCPDEAAAAAKIIKEAADKTGKIKLKAAFVEKQMFDGSQLDALVHLPSRKDLVAGILGSLQAPASGIVGVLNAVARDLVSVVDQIAEKKKAA